jgi:hypothetical protein
MCLLARILTSFYAGCHVHPLSHMGSSTSVFAPHSYIHCQPVIMVASVGSRLCRTPDGMFVLMLLFFLWLLHCVLCNHMLK